MNSNEKDATDVILIKRMMKDNDKSTDHNISSGDHKYIEELVVLHGQDKQLLEGLLT